MAETKTKPVRVWVAVDREGPMPALCGLRKETVLWDLQCHYPEWREENVTIRRATLTGGDYVQRLEAALAWALGESPEGYPEFLPQEKRQPAYWWRSTMRQIADGRIKPVPTRKRKERT